MCLCVCVSVRVVVAVCVCVSVYYRCEIAGEIRTWRTQSDSKQQLGCTLYPACANLTDTLFMGSPVFEMVLSTLEHRKQMGVLLTFTFKKN